MDADGQTNPHSLPPSSLISFPDTIPPSPPTRIPPFLHCKRCSLQGDHLAGENFLLTFIGEVVPSAHQLPELSEISQQEVLPTRWVTLNIEDSLLLWISSHDVRITDSPPHRSQSPSPPSSLQVKCFPNTQITCCQLFSFLLINNFML